MFKLVYSVLFFAAIYKLTDPNLKNVFNFSDRFIMNIIPNYTSNFLTNKWNYELDKMNDIELSYSLLEKINYVVEDYNKTGKCRYNMYLNGKKFRLATVFEISNKEREFFEINKPLQYHPVTFQKILVELVDQLPKEYVPYKLGIVEKNIKEGIFVAGIEKNVAFIIKELRPYLKAVKFIENELDYDGAIFSLEEVNFFEYRYENWDFLTEYTVKELL